jgi:hypothetical protein
MSNQSIADVNLDELEEELPVAKAVSSNREELAAPKGEEVEQQEEFSSEDFDSGDEQQSEQQQEDKPKQPGPVPYSRFSEKVIETREWKEKAEKAARELEELRQSQSKQEPTAQINPSDPYPDRYDEGIDGDDAKLAQRRAEWLDRRLESKLSEREQRSIQKSAKAEADSKRKAFEANLRSYAAENPDYADDVNEAGDPSWPAHIQAAIFESENGAKLDHQLLKDKEARERIMSLPPNRALYELGKLEASIVSNTQKKKQVAPKRTRAAAPVEQTVSGGGGRGPDIMDGYDIE